MKTKKTRIETVSETSTFLMLSIHNDGLRTGWCDQCLADVIWLVPTAIQQLGIRDLPEIEKLHMRGDEICSRSLIAK